mmetsp:Transcript_16293/g.42118  ORF Transcript_16293/g.42118 Transcript_16293/m.42118 type:complete len:363 (+) Transcript_16293:1-1089(+)
MGSSSDLVFDEGLPAVGWYFTLRATACAVPDSVLIIAVHPGAHTATVQAGRSGAVVVHRRALPDLRVQTHDALEKLAIRAVPGRLHPHQQVAGALQVSRGHAGLNHERVRRFRRNYPRICKLTHEVPCDVCTLYAELGVDGTLQHHLRIGVGLCLSSVDIGRQCCFARRRRRRPVAQEHALWLVPVAEGGEVEQGLVLRPLPFAQHQLARRRHRLFHGGAATHSNAGSSVLVVSVGEQGPGSLLRVDRGRRVVAAVPLHCPRRPARPWATLAPPEDSLHLCVRRHADPPNLRRHLALLCLLGELLHRKEQTSRVHVIVGPGVGLCSVPDPEEEAGEQQSHEPDGHGRHAGWLPHVGIHGVGS